MEFSKQQTQKNLAESQVKLNAFLTTSLNTELVYAILRGITILASHQTDNANKIRDEDVLTLDQENIIRLDKIKIDNAEEWEVGTKGTEIRTFEKEMDDYLLNDDNDSISEDDYDDNTEEGRK